MRLINRDSSDGCSHTRQIAQYTTSTLNIYYDGLNERVTVQFVFCSVAPQQQHSVQVSGNELLIPISSHSHVAFPVLILHHIHSHSHEIPIGKWELGILFPDADLESVESNCCPVSPRRRH